MTQMTKNIESYEIADAALYPLTADGASLTYGAKQDIPGIMEIQLTPGQVKTIRIEGDNKISRVVTRVMSYKLRVRHSAASFDVFATITGGTAATSGTTPNTTSSFTAKGADVAGMFKIASLTGAAKDKGSPNGGNGTFTAYKCSMTSPPVTTFNGENHMWEWEAEAFPTEADDKIYDFVANETAGSLS